MYSPRQGALLLAILTSLRPHTRDPAKACGQLPTPLHFLVGSDHLTFSPWKAMRSGPGPVAKDAPQHPWLTCWATARCLIRTPWSPRSGHGSEDRHYPLHPQTPVKAFPGTYRAQVTSTLRSAPCFFSKVNLSYQNEVLKTSLSYLY